MTSTGTDMAKALFWEDYAERMCLIRSKIIEGWEEDSNPDALNI